MSTTLIILAILFAAAAPLVWVLPSPRERRISALRRRALELGGSVQLRRIDHPAPTAGDRVSAGGRERTGGVEVPAYTLFADAAGAGRSRDPDAPRWRLFAYGESLDGRLLAVDPESGAAAPEGWSFDSRMAPTVAGTASYRQRLTEALATLPPVLGIERHGRGVTVFWEERGGVEQVDALIAGLRAVLAAEETAG